LPTKKGRTAASWFSKNGGLSSPLKRVASHTKEKGYSKQNAYQMAVGVFRAACFLKEAEDLASRLTESSPAGHLPVSVEYIVTESLTSCSIGAS
jgi:hypothetical protein